MVKQEMSVTCGIVMPISAIDGCAAEHWSDVKGIICEAVDSIDNPNIKSSLVSDADDVGVIQKRIVQNLYRSDIVICDVSGKNPNVMFELGMRLAFDKPTIIIKDDVTEYSFDTGVIEHLTYPRDLRFTKIVSFKALLCQKIIATLRASTGKDGHSTFLSNFGPFKSVSIREDVIPADKIVVEMLSDLQAEVARMRRAVSSQVYKSEYGIRMENIVGMIKRYIEISPGISVDSLKSNEKFFSWIENILEAEKYYKSQSIFRKHVDQALDFMLTGEGAFDVARF